MGAMVRRWSSRVLFLACLAGTACDRSEKPATETGGARDTAVDSAVDSADTGRDTGSDTSVDTADTADTARDTAVPLESALALCGGGGRASDGVYEAVACVAPIDPASITRATDGTHVLQSGPMIRIAPDSP